MSEGKKEDSTKKLEAEFHEFKEEWREFLTNGFSHLVAKVDTLVEQNEGIQKNMATMETKILEALGARAYDWGDKGK